MTGGRTCGKTMSEVLNSSILGLPLLVGDEAHKERIINLANLMQIKIPEVLVFSFNQCPQNKNRDDSVLGTVQLPPGDFIISF